MSNQIEINDRVLVATWWLITRQVGKPDILACNPEGFAVAYFSDRCTKTFETDDSDMNQSTAIITTSDVKMMRSKENGQVIVMRMIIAAQNAAVAGQLEKNVKRQIRECAQSVCDDGLADMLMI